MTPRCTSCSTLAANACSIGPLVRDAAPDDTYRQAFAKFLDSEHRVIIETNARLVVAFDVAKFQSFTNEAIQAGMN